MKHTSFCGNKSFTRAAKLAQDIGCAAIGFADHRTERVKEYMLGSGLPPEDPVHLVGLKLPFRSFCCKASLNFPSTVMSWVGELIYLLARIYKTAQARLLQCWVLCPLGDSGGSAPLVTLGPAPLHERPVSGPSGMPRTLLLLEQRCLRPFLYGGTSGP